MILENGSDPDDYEPPHGTGVGALLIGPAILLGALIAILLPALFGCAPASSDTVGLTNAKGDAVAVTFPIQSYTPEFSAKLAAELKAAPPELAQFTVDALKLRCAIKPSLPYCADLLK